MEAGNGAQAAALSHAQMLAPESAPAPVKPSLPNRPRLSDRLSRWKCGIEHWCERVEIAPDLACDIGSRRWLRGMATMLGLSVAAFAFWPDFSAVEAATSLPLAARERDEFRSQSIAPLALGADSGRHMGASPLVRPLASVPERPSVDLVATLGQGDSFARMLERIGVGDDDAARIGALVGQAVPLGEIAPGTQFDVTLGNRPAPGAPRALTAMDFRARFDLDLAIQRGGGGLSLVRRPIHVDETPLRIRGTVGSSLYRSARNAGAPVAAIQAYLQAVDKYLSLESDIRPNDEFDIVVAYKRSAKGEREIGNLLYAGLEHEGRARLQLLRWGQDGDMVAASGLADSSGSSTPAGMPVAGHMTSPYGMRRHPILGYVRMHAGIDFGAAYGSPIYAVADGTVTFSGRHGGHGNYVRIEHAGGLGTGYGHMSRIAVSAGSHVRAGQVIGYVGSSGLSTGPHLHFEAYRGGQTINPAGLRFTSRPQIDGREKNAFDARMKSLLNVQPGDALGAIAPATNAPIGAQREIDRLEPKNTVN
ncbi:peptidase M23-like protein [Novosphingobium sp. PhB165]|uniref:M23 family metallopeptidase n=1 Tax=Novosphingobium sp. PhB165 TaxID=2485105 RepID=UPI0010467D7A|nr:M23 family metallopeptidase [Novosphingobium sp. PhB165]TCM18520.1 peptidase M23-like protein [Novosphingobium sp. PhB165]